MFWYSFKTLQTVCIILRNINVIIYCKKFSLSINEIFWVDFQIKIDIYFTAKYIYRMPIWITYERQLWIIRNRFPLNTLSDKVAEMLPIISCRSLLYSCCYRPINWLIISLIDTMSSYLFYEKNQMPKSHNYYIIHLRYIFRMLHVS